MRSHITKSLKSRSGAIRRAVAKYNSAAIKLGRPALDWAQVSKFSFIEEFNLLKGTRNDIQGKRWVEPAVRETIKKIHRIARAQEELVRCNVEARRLHTAIRDEARLFGGILAHLSPDDPIYPALLSFIERRILINQYIMRDLEKLFAMPEFTGTRDMGVRIGSIGRPFACSTLTADQISRDINMIDTPQITPAAEGTYDDEESDEEDEEEDEETQHQLDTLTDWESRARMEW